MFDPEEEDFTSYLERLENFFTLRDTQDDSAKRCVLLGCLQREQFKQLSALTAPAKPSEKTYIQLIAILEKSFNPITSIHTERHRFLSRVQDKAETLASYISELKVIGKKCQWVCSDAACQKPFDAILQAQFIRGIRGTYIREKLLVMPPETTLENTLEFALALEAAHRQNVEEYADKSSEDLYIQKVSNENYPFSKSSRSRYPSISSQRHSSTTTYRRKCQVQERLHMLGLEDMCLRCGKPHHTAWECPVRFNTLRCTQCKRTGHVASVCISTKKREKQVNCVHSRQDLDVNSTTHQYIDLHSIYTSTDLQDQTFKRGEKYKRPESLTHGVHSRRHKHALPASKVQPRPHDLLHGGCLSKRGDCCVSVY